MARLFFVLLLGFCGALFANTEVISLESYSKHAQFIDVKISPSGKYLAVSSRADDGNIQIIVLDRLKLTAVSRTHFGGNDTISAFYWVNDERLILSLAREIGSLEQPMPTGELYAVNADGKRGIMLTGYRSKDKAYTASEIINLLPEDNKNIVISSRKLTSSEPFIEFYRLNVESGRKRRVGQAPIRAIKGSNIYAVTDNDGLPRMIVGVDPVKDTDTLLMYRSPVNNEWQELARFSEDSGRSFIPLAFSADNKTVFGLSNLTTDTQAIVKFDIATKEQEILAHHPLTDVMPIIALEKGIGTDVIGAAYEYENLDAVFFDNAADFSTGLALHSAVSAFPEKQVSITSATRDNKLAVIRVQSVNQDSVYYLFDMLNNKITYLLNSRPWFQEVVMPETQIVKYKARDGQDLLGLLTLPKHLKAEDLPLVLFPHGGPIGVRDSAASYGLYQANIKMLAENGYAVFQPNFRGSGGFGLEFQQSAYQKWGSLMIDDMTDGVRDLIKKGVVDQERICTFGASYGGYAAVQTAIREPDLYKCVIAYAGVFNLHALYTAGDISEIDLGVRFIERTVGRDAKILDEQSPIKNLDKLKAPVFIVHGTEDKRTPLSYAVEFKDELEKRGHSYEWLVKEKEGHGFYNSQNNIELWQKVLIFLNKNIGTTTE